MKFYSVLLFIIFLFLGCSDNDLGDVRKFQFTYQVKLSQSDQKIEVWFPIPQTNEIQIVSNEKLEFGELFCEELIESVHNNHYYYCSSEGLKNDMLLSYTCNIKKYEHGRVLYQNINSDNYGKGTNNTTVPEGDMFLDIILDNNLLENDIKLVYKYVLEGMHYGKPKSKKDVYYKDPWLTKGGEYGLKGVSRDDVVNLYQSAKLINGDYTFGNGNSIYACDIGVGNCTDYHSYFISLSRTMDVPARFHMGFSIPNGKSGKIGGYHCWADYFIEDQGWYPIDISEADKNPEKEDYFFGRLDYNRIEFTTGRDLELYNYKKHVNFFIYPLVKGTTFTKSFSYKDI